MEYSLNNLNLISNLNNLTLNQFINSLNLIGLEIDGISKKKVKLYQSLENIKILIKIPSNREDLLIEKFFIKEMSIIFVFDIFETWTKIKKNYHFLLKQKYFQYSNYSTTFLNSTLNSIITYSVEVENFQNFPSPLWIRNKLKNLGIEIFNNFNDIVNLVISEWGQLLNCTNIANSSENFNDTNYNLEYITKIEENISINGQLIELLPGTIVLRNKYKQILFILGVLTTVPNTCNKTKIIIETSFYDIEENSLLIHVTNPKVSLKLFRKMLLTNLKFSFQRLLSLIEILEYGSIIPKKYCTKKNSIFPKFEKILELKKKSLKNFLNIDIIDEKIFDKAGFHIICKTKNQFYFKISTSRKDLTREIDLIEEYSRFFGYKNFEEIIPQKVIVHNQKYSKNLSFLKQYFLNYGFNEVITNSIQDDFQKTLNSIEINNPLNKELSTLRITLLPKLLEVFSNNLRLSSNINNFFEIGRTFKKSNNQIIEENKFGVVFQIPDSNLINSKENSLEWFVSLGFIENLLKSFNYKEINKEKISFSSNFFHPTRSISFKIGKKTLGTFGQLNPNLQNFSILKKPTYFLELNLIYFSNFKLFSTPIVYKEYSKYPKIIKDLSFLINKNINFKKLKNALQSNSNYLKKITFFDIYFEKDSNELINIGIRFEFQSLLFTLTNEIIEIELEKLKLFLILEFKIKFKN